MPKSFSVNSAPGLLIISVSRLEKTLKFMIYIFILQDFSLITVFIIFRYKAIAMHFAQSSSDTRSRNPRRGYVRISEPSSHQSGS